jgi:hypothetical protein
MFSSLLKRLFVPCCSLPDSPPGTSSCDIMDYALYEHELYNKNFDGLDAKASGIVQFVAIVLGLTAFQVHITSAVSWWRIGSLAAFAIALVLAVRAWCVSDAEGVPKALDVRARLIDRGKEETQKELIEQLTQSSSKTRQMCLAKSRWLMPSFWLLQIGVGLLIFSLALR